MLSMSTSISIHMISIMACSIWCSPVYDYQTHNTTVVSRRRVGFFRRIQQNHNWPNGGRIQRTTVNQAKRWNNGVIYFLVDNSLARYRGMINNAMEEIESRTCVRFRPRRNEQAYIYLTNGNGCHSNVGRMGGKQIVSLGEGCHDVGSILHELCHAVGLYHEHMRYDRDQFLQIKWNNIAPSMYEQFQKIPVTQYRPSTTFDYNSIMIYGPKAFSKNGKDTMIPRVQNATMYESHFKTSLSASDVINIKSMYGCQ